MSYKLHANFELHIYLTRAINSSLDVRRNNEHMFGDSLEELILKKNEGVCKVKGQPTKQLTLYISVDR